MIANHVMGNRICVVLPTWNGAAWLDAQFASIAAQTLPPVEILVRDDGSTDDTRKIIATWAHKLPIVMIDVWGKHEGLLASMQKLIRAVDISRFDAVAFCDQDDVWHEDKLARAAEVLADFPDRPALYCASAILTDEALNPIGQLPYPEKGPDFANALVENIVTGCTAALNRQALIALQAPWPKGVLVHDWWAYLVISAIGTVIYDPRQVLLYRQHSKNMVGAKAGKWQQWQGRFARFKSRKRHSLHPLRAQAQALRHYLRDNFPTDSQRLLDDFANNTGLSPRHRQLWRQSRIDHLALRVMMLLGYV